jgi:phage shock protein PspC (stress-responsive transcriptional regulator)
MPKLIRNISGAPRVPSLTEGGSDMDLGTRSPRRLTRSTTDSMVAGVAGGIAEYLDVDPTIVRLGWVLATLFTGPVAPLLYVICWFVMPRRNEISTF